MGVLLYLNDKAVKFDLRCLLLFFSGAKTEENWVTKDEMS